MSEEITAGNVDTKLTNFQTGVVVEENLLYDELGISNTGSETIESWVWVKDNDHYITSPYSIGDLQIHLSSDDGTYLGGNWADDLRILVQWNNGSKDCLGVLSESAAIDLSGNEFAVGRRVSLPIGGVSYDWDNLNPAGRDLIKRSIEWAATYEPQERFFRDLRALAYTSSNDNRPFTGAIDIDLTAQGDTTEEKLEDWLGLTVNDVAATLPANDWVLPSGYSTYRIYEGGPEYTVQAITVNVLTADLAPDPATNPLGIYYHATGGDLVINSNVDIEGTLISTKKIKLDGTNINLTAHNIESLNESSIPIRLPTLICENLELEEESTVSITGLVAVFQDVILKKGGADNAFTIEGRLVFDEKFEVYEHTSWKDLNYLTLYQTFDTQEIFHRFPSWIASDQSIALTPRIQIKPDPTEVTYHWLKPISGEPIFVPPTGGSGLQFQVINWGDE